MAGETTSASLGDSLQYIQDSARMRREYGTVMTRVVDKRTLPANSGRAWDEITVERLDAQSVDESTNLDNFQSFVDSLFSVEPVMTGIATFITDKARSIVSTETLGATGSAMQNALERRKDLDGLTVLDSGTSFGGAGTTLTSGILSAAQTENTFGAQTGSNAEGWTGRQVAVLNSRQIKDLRDEVTSGIGTYPTPNGLTEEIYRQGYRGMVDGLEIFVDDLMTIDASDDAKGGVFAAGKDGAIVFVQGPGKKTKERYNPAKGGGGVEVYQYDDYAYGIRLANSLSEIYTDSAAVTS